MIKYLHELYLGYKSQISDKIVSKRLDKMKQDINMQISKIEEVIENFDLCFDNDLALEILKHQKVNIQQEMEPKEQLYQRFENVLASCRSVYKILNIDNLPGYNLSSLIGFEGNLRDYINIEK